MNPAKVPHEKNKRPKDMEQNYRFIISGGGTGGHIFPAVSIANALREQLPEAEILFVGAEGRMEMQRVPAAGYRIIGLPVAGFDRQHLLRNISVLWKLWKSRRRARRIVREFRPDAAVGVGGYASGPTLEAAENAGIPTLLQEQNSYAGVTNKLLARKAQRICVAYEHMERFFPAEKILLTGNPVRQNLLNEKLTREEGIRFFGLDPAKRTVLVVGGSLGARTINQSILAGLPELCKSNIQVIWQCGKYYYAEMLQSLRQAEGQNDDECKPCRTMPLHLTDFIGSMSHAYAAADLVISRAGAGSISEFCLLGKPVILVPSPNVAEDHQTKNALALVEKDAALMVRDADATGCLMKKAIELVEDPQRLARLAANIRQMAHPDAAKTIANEVIKLAQSYRKEHGNK
jgi:UDP-N-acetylglucosamine--N-acetylmuramyl-(pentapeptide) pyrophosphoryl-undecaprenol N-acetylglucosamine transferase